MPRPYGNGRLLVNDRFSLVRDPRVSNTPNTTPNLSLARMEYKQMLAANQMASATMKIALICATDSEYRTIVDALEGIIGPPTPATVGDDRPGFKFSWTLPARRLDIFCMRIDTQGAVGAGIDASAIAQQLGADHLLMIGMSMGIRGGYGRARVDHLSVVVSREIFFFDHRTVGTDGEQLRLHGDGQVGFLYRALVAASARAKAYGFGEVSLELNKSSGCATVKIENPQHKLIKEMRKIPDLVSYEMESWGILQFVRATKASALVIKGIADFGDQPDRKKKTADQEAATRNATLVALGLLRFLGETAAIKVA